jgi:hypothetical protein
VFEGLPRRWTIVLLGLLACASAAAQRPTPDQQRHTLDAAREIAIHYSAKLPDFICTENVERTDHTSPTNIKADRLTVQLSYFGQKLDGLISAGEFGSLLLGVFDPAAATDFAWKGRITCWAPEHPPETCGRRRPATTAKWSSTAKHPGLFVSRRSPTISRPRRESCNPRWRWTTTSST